METRQSRTAGEVHRPRSLQHEILLEPAGVFGRAPPRLKKVVMLHNERSRRVATGGRATAVRRYHVVLLLLLCLTASPATTVAIGGQSGRVFHSFFGVAGVGSERDGVGVERRASAASGDQDSSRTAAKQQTCSRRKRRSEFSAGSRGATAAAAYAGPPTDAWVRERYKGMLSALRGGSEGLKSKEWIREKAAAGSAAKRGAGETVDQVRFLFFVLRSEKARGRCFLSVSCMIRRRSRRYVCHQACTQQQYKWRDGTLINMPPVSMVLQILPVSPTCLFSLLFWVLH